MKSLRAWRFATEYVANGYDGKEAAILAGYSKNSAYGAAYRLLKTSYVQRVIERHQLDVEAKALIDRDALIKQLHVIAFARVSDFMTLNKNGSLRFKTKEEIGTGPETAVIKLLKSNVKGVTIGLELEDKMAALETLLRMLTPVEESTEKPHHDIKSVSEPQSTLAQSTEPQKFTGTTHEVSTHACSTAR